MKSRKRLLILGPSFRRRKDEGLLPAIERFDGLFLRIARKHLRSTSGIEVAIMRDDLILVESKALIAYAPPIGHRWGERAFSEAELKDAKLKNTCFLGALSAKSYAEIFIVIGKTHCDALPDLSGFRKVTFASGRSLGTKAQTLVKWLASLK
jgi:hypothetical protein